MGRHILSGSLATRSGWHGGAIDTSVLDPRDVQQLMLGGIWLPSAGVVAVGGGKHKWQSQAEQTNDWTSVHTDTEPTLTTADNGAAIWNMPDASPSPFASSWRIPSPGSALRWTGSGSYAFWVRVTGPIAQIRTLFETWPEDGTANPIAGHNRIRAYINYDGTPHTWPITFVSWLGTGLDWVDPGPTVNGVVRADRAKGNGQYQQAGAPTWDDTWHFVRITIDDTADNWTGDGVIQVGGFTSQNGVHYSRRLRFYIDEVLQLVYYSAPQSGSALSDDVPAPGPVHTTDITGVDLSSNSVASTLPYASTSALSLGCSGSAGSGLIGDVGPFYVANGYVSNAMWARIKQFEAPA